MSRNYFISDHHFGHANIIKFEHAARPFASVADHDEWLIAQHNRRVKKRDTVWFGGDVAFDLDVLEAVIPRLAGTLHIVYGNHDHHGHEAYSRHFGKVRPFREYHGWLISHMPTHGSQIKSIGGGRYRGNLHGHTHSQIVDDYPYVNMCVEQCDGVPRTFEEWTARESAGPT